MSPKYLIGAVLIILLLTGCEGGGGASATKTQSQNGSRPANQPALPLLNFGMAAGGGATQVAPGTASANLGSYVLDTTASSEGIEVSAIPVHIHIEGAGVTNITNVRIILDGVTQNVAVSPSTPDFMIYLVQPLQTSQGVLRVLELRADISAAIPLGTRIAVGITATADAFKSMQTKGITSQRAALVKTGNLQAATITVASSTLSVTLDSTSPAYRGIEAGLTNVLLCSASFRSGGEQIALQGIGFKLTAGQPSYLAGPVNMYVGEAVVGHVQFVGNNKTARGVLTANVVVDPAQAVVLAFTADITAIGPNQPLQTSGAKLALDVDASTTTGVGQNSGLLVTATGSTASAGVRIFRSRPRFGPDTSLQAQGLMNGTQVPLMRFVAGGLPNPVGIAKFTFQPRYSGCTLTNLRLYGFSDSSYSLPIGQTNDARLSRDAVSPTTSGAIVAIYPTTASGAKAAVQLPGGGQFYFFELRGDVVTTTGTSPSIMTTLLADGSPMPADGMATADAADQAHASLVWSPNTSGFSALTDSDWTSGARVEGFVNGMIIQTRSQ